MGLFDNFRTARRVAQLESDMDELKRLFRQMQQEWDATSMRVTKTLRRLRSAEERRDRPGEVDDDENGDGTQASLPLTSVGTSPDRMTRIKQQLAARSGKAGE